MTRERAKERLPTQMQLHLMVEMHHLPDLVVEVGEAVLAGVGMDPTDEALRSKAALAVENVLRKYVRAFEFCGFTKECHASQEYDPWQIRDEVGNWEGDWG